MSNGGLLFDKIINIYLMDENKNVIDQVVCPQYGRKPDISLSGQFIPCGQVMGQELRIRNFTPRFPLSDYKWFSVKAGYAQSVDIPVQLCFEGQIFNAYTERPGPDGITYFYILLGNYTELLQAKSSTYTRSIGKFFKKGVSLAGVVENIANALGMDGSKIYLDKDRQLPAGFAPTGVVKDDLQKLKEMFPTLGFDFQNNYLIVFNTEPNDGQVGKYSSNYHEIKYVISPPKKDAAGLTVIAPWNPQIRPGDYVRINSVYMKQTFGGAMVETQVKFCVLSIDYQFATVSEENSMTLIMLIV